MDPTRVVTPRPEAAWRVGHEPGTYVKPTEWAEGYEVRRYHDARSGETVSLTRTDGENPHRHSTFHCSPAGARQLGDALHAAAEWTPGTHPAPARPEIVCLCGSTRFYDAFQRANYEQTMAGRIVLSVGFYPHASAEHGHGEGVGHDSAQKVALDELHKRKIDLADRVLVLNVDGYIGDSTRSEIDYAKAHGKPIDWLEGETVSESSGSADR